MKSENQRLPEQFSEATLERNLAFLAAIDENLFQRICMPVDGAHIHFLDGGEIRYERHRARLPFVIDKEGIENTLGDVGDAKNILLFGIGLGGQLDYILQQFSTARITVWDRDPWLVRLVLMQKDYSEHLRSGRLKICMGIDILDILTMARHSTVIYHPFMRQVYRNEQRLLERGVGEKRAIICSEDLFADDVSKAFEEFGFSVYTLDIRKLSLEEMAVTVRRFNPQVVFAVNYMNGLAEFCHKSNVDLVCWEVDPTTDRLKACTAPADRAHIFTYRKANVSEFVDAGFKNVEHLFLASDIEKRSAPHLSPEEQETYGAPLSFVGSSMIDNANTCKNIFLSHYKTYRGDDNEAVGKGVRLLEAILAEQRKDLSRYLIPNLLREQSPGFLNYLSGLSSAHDPFMLVGEIAAAEKRINYLAGLHAFDVRVWGDKGWRMAEQYGVKYMGSAGHTSEINKIYGASRINVDINRIYQMDIIPMRIFDIMACGGFVLAEHSDDLCEIFEAGREVVTYRTVEELGSKTEYYLDHGDEALEIAERGREAVIKNHTISMRVRHMLESSSGIKLS
ncbi:MAG: glycosyltransferase [Deltaproteobacteria bacterium]|nr:glycosyltransferase [Deltaproteobacteria bacterium]